MRDKTTKKKTMIKRHRILSLIAIPVLILVSCEGPAGPSGADGTDGIDGKDANETCKLCHNNSVVLAKAFEYEYAQHFKGEAFEEGTRNNCAPCHSHQGFLDVIQKNTPATITVNPSDPTKFINNYVASASALSFPGPKTVLPVTVPCIRNTSPQNFFRFQPPRCSYDNVGWFKNNKFSRGILPISVQNVISRGQ
jgi:hypothetical protein